MAKKQKKNKAPKAAKAQKASKGAGKPRAAANVYTGLTFIATVMLSVALGFVLYRSSELFGSVGELFDLKASQQPVRMAAPAPAPTPDAAPLEAEDQ